MPKKVKSKPNMEPLAFIYARRSSDRQNEESTAQQVAVCREMADRLGYTVIRVYADEAVSGKTDRRPEFQKMVRAIEAGKCNIVIAYKSNRIARNMLQALTYENKFEQCGVRLVYAKEEFGDNAAGRFALRNMMNLNQFYSENMSEDIKRCLYAYAEECKVLNGRIPLGYRKGEDGKYHLAQDGSVGTVQEIFTLYCAGIKSSAIVQALNSRGVKTALGKRFTVGTIESILKNEKYKGVYKYGDIRIPNGVPRIVSDEIWQKAQERLSEARRAPAKSWGYTDYLLTGKLFCGHCGASMIGDCGTGRNNAVYNYYVCYNIKKKGVRTCNKKRIRKELLEDIVINFTVQYALTDETINKVAEEAIKIQESDKFTIEHRQHLQHLAEVQLKIRRIVDAILEGIRTPTMKEEMDALNEEQERLSQIIAEERCEKPAYTKEQLVKWMTSLRDRDKSTPQFRKQIIDIFVNSIYLYDDHFTISYHTGEKKDVMAFSTATELDNTFRKENVSNLVDIEPPKHAQSNSFGSKMCSV